MIFQALFWKLEYSAEQDSVSDLIYPMLSWGFHSYVCVCVCVAGGGVLGGKSPCTALIKRGVMCRDYGSEGTEFLLGVPPGRGHNHGRRSLN